MTRRMVVGITGASGAAYGIRLLDELRVLGIESHLVMSKAAELTLAYESDLTPREVRAKADVVHAVHNVAASIASGSFRTMGMVIAPCSVRTLGEIASGVSSSVLTRAADVTLKERRPLVLMLRESPLNLIHIRNLETVTLAGATVCLPAPAFYNRPQTVDEIVDDGVGRLLDQFHLESTLIRRWTDDHPAPTEDAS
ncbi:MULTISPECIES: UbiX family flavin prenyltransferase [unclassified Curtobacterium]|uniref:UbiX family flavin prenyltransferase n=1 Tax=unclassified Curtobacterium TaxID=257496 RepID=UPI000DA74B05|nr:MULTISPECIES: UbiX family flavin prenyltransferase [unclassified Curtobacterium]PZE22956.1 3-octaprenyl-4-hydroxybenzoate carboxy-lyase [Curtobacterium sp. MCBD17_028]PZE76265.1 3-octaprenyl-4-hydroxybenzoate carboxy-lyase [Curtobacterium sp. MCBD17_019]PZF60088.1 3-octaprenyl-4-hydroxybenzoate carboxy-lyase [Curtobacterium sp. MCBD17_034]PZM34773.1 3-octaprenyl-4-hydroxybenzoate carboxy-lyase [Curtobacterium sp. MCBD17_031]